MKINIPELSLVLLVGPSGCGKSSFSRKHFLPTEVVSSDFCRALVSGQRERSVRHGGRVRSPAIELFGSDSRVDDSP